MAAKLKILYSFRARIVLVMAVLMALTVPVLYVVNQQAEDNIKSQVEEQTNALISAIDVVVRSLNETEWLAEIEKRRVPEDLKGRLLHSVITDSSNRVVDSSNPEDIGKVIPLPLTAKPDSGPLTINGDVIDTKESARAKSVIFSVETTGGLHHLIVVISTARLDEAISETARVLLIAVIGVFLLVMTASVVFLMPYIRPVTVLSQAARRVASGDLNFNVGINRKDEVGELAKTFDEMLAGLRHKRELEEKLSQAERSAVVGRLASGIAHEIRNPLNYINLSIDHVGSKFPPQDQEVRAQFARILSSVKDEIARLNRLVNDFLNYGRPMKLSLKTVNLRRVVDDVIALVRNTAEDRGVQIGVEESTPAPIVEADAELLKSCFSNILINAIQAMPAGGKVTFRLSQDNDSVQIEIIDTGTGIAPEALEQIFEPYYSTKETGIGLGLAVTKKIIEEHQGTIEVESSLGTGTKFTIVLPHSPGEAAVAGQQKAEAVI